MSCRGVAKLNPHEPDTPMKGPLNTSRKTIPETHSRFKVDLGALKGENIELGPRSRSVPNPSP